MGDTNMCTDNPVLLRRVHNEPTIVCIQRKAEKKIVEEEDIIQANKLAFNDDIGIVTNHVTSMIERRALFEQGTKEYDVLTYRIMCGQLYQQNTIDRAKGIIAKPMPTYWYSYRDCIPKDDDSEKVLTQKDFNRRIVASVKPYFMKYVYPTLKTEHRKYEKEHDEKVAMRFGADGISTIHELFERQDRTPEMKDFLNNYIDHMPVGNSACVINKISWLGEKELHSFSRAQVETAEFDPTILKSDNDYKKSGQYQKVKEIYRYFKPRQAQMMNSKSAGRDDDAVENYGSILDMFKRECAIACSNESELCDILVDLCYEKEYSKAFAWQMVGEEIVRNLLAKSEGKIHYPLLVEDAGEFSFGGANFVMAEKEVGYETHHSE